MSLFELDHIAHFDLTFIVNDVLVVLQLPSKLTTPIHMIPLGTVLSSKKVTVSNCSMELCGFFKLSLSRLR